MHLLFFDFC